jgi:hypothetical protein
MFLTLAGAPFTVQPLRARWPQPHQPVLRYVPLCSVVGSHAAVMRCRRRLAHDVAQAQERDALRLASKDSLLEAPDLTMCTACVQHIGHPEYFSAKFHKPLRLVCSACLWRDVRYVCKAEACSSLVVLFVALRSHRRRRCMSEHALLLLLTVMTQAWLRRRVGGWPAVSACAAAGCGDRHQDQGQRVRAHGSCPVALSMCWSCAYLYAAACSAGTVAAVASWTWRCTQKGIFVEHA